MGKKKKSDNTLARRATREDAEVGKRVRERRHKLGLSQTELAEQIGVTFQQVQKYENGTNRIGAGRLQRIAEALHVKEHDFFNDEQVMLEESAFGRPLTRDELRLLRAFDKIRSKAVRKLFVSLTEAFLDLESEAAPDPGP